MQECPCCGEVINADDLYHHGELDDHARYHCPHCGAALRITEELYYVVEEA